MGVRDWQSPSYMGTFTGARRCVLQTFATTQSALMKKRVAQYMVSGECSLCHGKRLRRESLSVTFAGLDIGELSLLPLKRVAEILRPAAEGTAPGAAKLAREHPEKALVAERIAKDLLARIQVLMELGLGPGAGDEGGRVVAAGTPAEVAASSKSRTAPFLAEPLGLKA